MNGSDSLDKRLEAERLINALIDDINTPRESPLMQADEEGCYQAEPRM